MFDLIPQINYLYNICVLEDVTEICSRNAALKYSFFQSSILELKKLDRQIRQSLICLLTFRNSLSKIARLLSKASYNIRNPNALKKLTRLRLGLSQLNNINLIINSNNV